MKSSVQQYISIFLVVCLFVFFGVGIASDGFTDFDVFKPMPVTATAETEVEDCSYVLTAQSEQADPITWQNERVEYEFTLASGDINSDAGFSISSEGILTFTNFDYALSRFDYDYLADYEGQGYVYSSVTLEMRFSVPTSASSSFRWLRYSRSAFVATGGSIDLVREVCRNYTYAENLSIGSLSVNFSISLMKEDYSSLNSTSSFGSIVYKGFINFLDRVDFTGLYEKPVVEEGYIFDGWYTDPGFENSSFYGVYSPNQLVSTKFLYSDVAIDLYPKVSPAVTVSIDLGDEVKSIKCAVGTSSLNSISVSNSNLIAFFQRYCHSGDEFYTDSGIVITSDMVMLGGTKPIVDFVVESDMVFYYEPFIKEVTVTFYVGEDVFYTCKVERGTSLDIDTIPLPAQPGYDFRDWRKVSDGTLFNGGLINENTSISANFDLHYYTVTLTFPEGYTTEGGRTSFTQTGVSHLTNNYYRFPYGDVFELVGVDGLLYKTDGWITEDGADYDFCSPIYTDLNLYAKVVRLQYKVSYWYKDYPSSYALKIVEYYPGDLVDYERDIADYLNKPGYGLSLLVPGSGSAAGQYFEYDYAPVESNVSLYLKYTAYEYTVNFHSDYKLSFDNVICTCEDKLSLPEFEPRLGYDFLGWFYKDGSLFEENTVILSDLELYAKWQIQRKTVTLVTAGEVQTSFEVDYGTSLDDVIKQINYKNYNVVSFSADGFTDESCFIDDVYFEVAAMDKQESIINTVKNKWQLIVGIVAGVLLLVCFLSVISKSTKKYGRKRK